MSTATPAKLMPRKRRGAELFEAEDTVGFKIRLEPSVFAAIPVI